jgi:hypothetical protein
MLNWDDEIRLSRHEVAHARRLAVARLDAAIGHTENLLFKVLQLDASPERDQLIDRILALHTERLSIKRDRLAQLDRMLPNNERVVSVRARDLKAAFNRYDYGGYKIIRRNGAMVSFDASKLLRPREYTVERARKSLGLRIREIGRASLRDYRRTQTRGFGFAGTNGLAFLDAVLHRSVIGRLTSRCVEQTRQPRRHPICSRSIACRSRMLAPLGAPPLDY